MNDKEKTKAPKAIETRAGMKVGDDFETGKRTIKKFHVSRLSDTGLMAYDHNGNGQQIRTETLRGQWRKVAKEVRALLDIVRGADGRFFVRHGAGLFLITPEGAIGVDGANESFRQILAELVVADQ